MGTGCSRRAQSLPGTQNRELELRSAATRCARPGKTMGKTKDMTKLRDRAQCRTSAVSPMLRRA